MEWGFLRLISDKESACQCRRHKRCGFDPWVRKIPWRKKRQPTPVFLPGKFHGQRKLVGYNQWSIKESDMTEWLSTHTVWSTELQYLYFKPRMSRSNCKSSGDVAGTAILFKVCKWQPTPVFLPGESHGWRSLAGPWGRKESDTTEHLHFTFTSL